MVQLLYKNKKKIVKKIKNYKKVKLDQINGEQIEF